MVPPLQSPLPPCQNLSLSPIHPQNQTTSGEPLQSRRYIVQTDGSPSHRLTPPTRDSASLSHNLRVIIPTTTKKSGQQTRVKSTINIQDKTNKTFISRSRPLFLLFQDRRLTSLVRKERNSTTSTKHHRPIPQDKPTHRHLDKFSTLLSPLDSTPRSPRLDLSSPCNNGVLVTKSSRSKRKLSATKNLRPCNQDKTNHRHLDDSSTLLFNHEPLPRSPRPHPSLPCNDAALLTKSRRRRRTISETINHRTIDDKPNHRHLDDSSTLSSTPESLPRSPRLNSPAPFNDGNLVNKSRRHRKNLPRINYCELEPHDDAQPCSEYLAVASTPAAELCTDQDSIGWEHFVRGRLSLSPSPQLLPIIIVSINWGGDSPPKMVFNCDRLNLRYPPASLGRILLRNFTYRQYKQDFISQKKNSLVPGRNILQTIWYSQKAPKKLVCTTNKFLRLLDSR